MLDNLDDNLHKDYNYENFLSFEMVTFHVKILSTRKLNHTEEIAGIINNIVRI